MLEGWEVKSIRAGRINITEAFVQVKGGEVFVHNMLITPLITASTHVEPQNNRIRKLLLNKKEIEQLSIGVERKGFTLVSTALYWKGNKLKLAIHLAKGKDKGDKRDTEKARDWAKQKGRILKKKYEVGI